MQYRYFFLAILFLSVSFLANAQEEGEKGNFKFGLKFAPQLQFNGVNDKDDDDGVEYNNDGVGVGIQAGIIADYFISDFVAFHTGLLYSSKRLGLEASNAQNLSSNLEFRMQYLQFPVAMKFFTNDFIVDDLKLYFPAGGTLDLKIAEEIRDSPSGFPTDERYIRTFDISLLLGIGAEYDLGSTTKLFGGIFYNRGLINTLRNESFDDGSGGTFNLHSDTRANNQQLGLEVGLKF